MIRKRLKSTAGIYTNGSLMGAISQGGTLITLGRLEGRMTKEWVNLQMKVLPLKV